MFMEVWFVVTLVLILGYTVSIEYYIDRNQDRSVKLAVTPIILLFLMTVIIFIKEFVI